MRKKFLAKALIGFLGVGIFTATVPNFYEVGEAMTLVDDSAVYDCNGAGDESAAVLAESFNAIK